ncbi:MAG: HupE/UreJ family protein [Hyphomicrobiales bacterium]|nr:HupE/UreJ family protein [Hyphomicrobiales bacterium]
MKLSLIAAAAWLAASAPAYAHHPLGGKTPDSLMEGLLSGLGHPMIGLDHFAFIVGVGLLSAYFPRRFALIGVFIVATALGCALMVQGVALPGAEFVIAGSVLVVGAALALSVRPPAPATAALFAAAGVFHGCAYGEAIVGAEPTPLGAYLAGFALIQFAIAGAASMLARRLAAPELALATPVRLAGAVVLGVGLTFLAENAEAMFAVAAG